MKISTIGRQPSKDKISKITTGSGNITTGRSGPQANSRKQKGLSVVKIGLPVDIVENRQFPNF